MRIILLFTLIVAGPEVLGQGVSFDWAASFGKAASNSYSICGDSMGNVYSTGWFFRTQDFDPGPDSLNFTTTSSDDIFVSKLNAAGNLVWAKHMNGTWKAYGASISTDEVLNVYVSGGFNGTVDFDPGAGAHTLTNSSHQYYDIFICKLDSSGNYAWAKKIGGAVNDFACSMIADRTGNTYTTGYFEGTVDFDPSAGTHQLTSSFGSSVFVIKLDDNGNFIWAKNLGGTSFTTTCSIVKDDAGNLYITGNFEGTQDFDPGPGIFNLTSSGAQDVFICKLDSAGNFIWAKSFGGSSTDEGYSITADQTGHIFCAGYFQSTVDFDPGAGVFQMTSLGSQDIFITKLDTTGNFIWAKSIGGAGSDEARSIAVDSSGNIWVAGNFSLTDDFDPGVGVFPLSSSSYEHVFVLKLNSNGDFIWAEKIGGSDMNKLIINPDGSICIHGKFLSTVDFDPGPGVFDLTATIYESLYILKLNDLTVGVREQELESNGGMTIFPNPARSAFKIKINSEFKGDERELKIYNSIGELIYAEKISQANQNIEKEIYLNKESNGLFYVIIESSLKRFSGILIKE